MLHLISFDDLDSDVARACLRQYRDGDWCVFADLGHRIAAEFPLRGPAFLLQGEEPLPELPVPFEVIDYDRLVALMAEQDGVVNWYP